MTAVRTWLRLDLRRRWRSLLVLALLVAVSSGTVMTALAGATRGMSSMERLASETNTIEAAVLPNTPHFDWDPFRDLPYVESMSVFYLPQHHIGIEGVSTETENFPHEPAWGTELEVPVVIEGRMYRTDAVDEVVVTPGFAESYDKGVGDVLEMHLPSEEQTTNAGDGESIDDPDLLAGPVVQATIVGIVRSPWLSDGPDRPHGVMDTSPGFIATYMDELMGKGDNTWANAVFDVENPTTDIPKLRDDIERIAGRTDIDVWDMRGELETANDQLRFEGRSLLAFGGAALLAALFLVGQAIARYSAAAMQELETGRALGLTPRQIAAASVGGPLLAAGAGALLGAAASVIASGWFPIGTAHGVEPHPGVDVDWPVLVVGVVGTIVAAGAVGLGSAALGLRARDGVRPARESRTAAAVSRLGMSVPTQIGTRFALEKGRGRTAIPVRPALVGAVAGILGVIAVFSFSHGIEDAIDHPERFGMTYQQMAFVGFNGQDFTEQAGVSSADIVDALRGLDYVSGVADDRNGVVTRSGGDGSVALHTWEPGEKQLSTVISEGRMPETRDEVVLTPGTLDSLGLGVGDSVELTGGRGTRELEIVGSGFVPVAPHNGYNDGGWVTGHGFDALFEPDEFKFHVVLVSVEDAARGDGLAQRLSDDVTAALPELEKMGGAHFSAPSDEELGVDVEIGNLKQVRELPLALGIFLAILAVGAVGHAIATAVRRRAHDLAVLRAVGMTRGQVAGIVITQATVIVIVGLLFGVALGVAAGRTVWRVVADYTPLEYVTPTSLLALSLIGPAALLVAYIVAAWPAVRSTRLRVATILRAE